MTGDESADLLCGQSLHALYGQRCGCESALVEAGVAREQIVYAEHRQRLQIGRQVLLFKGGGVLLRQQLKHAVVEE